MKTNLISTGLAIQARTITTTRHVLFRRAWLWTGFLAFATIAFGPQPAKAAVIEAWVQRYGSEAGSADYAPKVVTDAAGNVIVAGSTANQTGPIVKYSGAGVPLWTNRYDNSRHPFDPGHGALAVDGSGNVFVTGSLGSGSEMLIIKYSGTGVPLWTNRYHGTGDGLNRASAAAVDGSGNVFVAGNSTGSAGNPDYVTIAYSDAGVPLWTNRYNGLGNDQDFANAVAVDASGNVFVAGDSVGSGGSMDYATIALSSAGVPLWTNHYSGSGIGVNRPTAVAVDGSGNVFVTGYSSDSSGFDSDYATIAYSGAGVPLWTNRYDGLGNGGDYANALAVDGSGNVFVTGSSVGSAGSNDYATIAYSGAGVPLWTNRYNGPGNSDDRGSAVAVDASGNVFVTGSSTGSGGDSDYATIAYSGTGVPLWTNRYNGMANGSDEASAVAVDGNGNVFVTGSSVGIGGESDFVTVKYVHFTNVQLIINGGFETPDTPTYMQINAGQNTIAPWVVGLHSVEVGDAVGNGIIVGPAFEGAQFLDLNGLQRGRITQTFATTPGSCYTLTFAYTDNYWEPSTTGSASARVRVFDGLGDRLNQTITHSGAIAGNYHWTIFNEQFTAVTNTTRLEFTSLSNSAGGHSGGIMLDAVQVTLAVRATLVLQGSGATLNWTGGVPPYRVQRATDLTLGDWTDVLTNAVPPVALNLERQAEFYRIVGQ